MINFISDLLGNLKNILIYGILAIVIIFCLVILLKYPNTKKITLYVMACVIIVIGGICSYKVYDMFNIYSSEIGTAIHITTEEKFGVVSNFDFGYIEFDTEDYNNYLCVTSFAQQNFDGNNKDYMIIVNNQPVENLELSRGRIAGDLVIKFYSVDGNISSTANLSIIIEYLSSEIRITTSMTNVDNSVSYLESYMEINGFVVQVVERS